MPAYFNLSLQFRREDLYPDFVKDFFDALELAGLKYLSGYGEAVKIAVLAHTARSTRAILPKQESHLAGWLN